MLLGLAGCPQSCHTQAAAAHDIAPHPRQNTVLVPKGMRVGKEGNRGSLPLSSTATEHTTLEDVAG